MPREEERKKIPPNTKIRVWALSGGRCAMTGCNKALWEEPITKSYMNRGYIAHIISPQYPKGPRSHPELSDKLATCETNLMLLCDEHHRWVDTEKVKEFPVTLLQKIKADHEKRIAHLTSLTEDKKTTILLYGENIGTHTSPLSWSKTQPALLNDGFYPDSPHPIEISLKNSLSQDHLEHYWTENLRSLEQHYEQNIKGRLRSGTIERLAVFALAPQPLLIKLGVLLGDITNCLVYQSKREPAQTWFWDTQAPIQDFITTKPQAKRTRVALNFSLSGNIEGDRIRRIIGDDVSIWKISINSPNNDFVHNPEQLVLFRTEMRRVFEEIKDAHGQETELHVFPAMPVSLAVELGRVWMPKAQNPMIIYEQNSLKTGFFKAIEI